jgi:hypothetical protein
VSVEVGQGCSGLGGSFREIATDMFTTDIMLAGTLATGETATLEYQTLFRYQTVPAPEFRRTVVVSMENLDIRVQFHPDKMPRSVLWAVWNGLDGPIVASEPVELDSQCAVHRFLRFAQQTVAGFRWEW